MVQQSNPTETNLDHSETSDQSNQFTKDGSLPSSPIHQITQSPPDNGGDEDGRFHDDDEEASPLPWHGNSPKVTEGRRSISPDQREMDNMEEDVEDDHNQQAAEEMEEEEEELFSWDQLILPKMPSKELIFNVLQNSSALQWFLSRAFQVCQVPESPRIPALAPHGTMLAELDLWQDLLRHVQHLNDSIFRECRAQLEEAFERVEAFRPMTRTEKIANLEAEIAWLEEQIVDEQEALARKYQHELAAQLRDQERQIPAWHALATLLANVELPEADDTSPTGFCYKFPIPLLGSDVVLRPTPDVSTDLARLDEIFSPNALELPEQVVDFFRGLVSLQLSAVLAFDFEPAARYLTTFLGRLDRTLDDIYRACGLWQHKVHLNGDKEGNVDAIRLMMEFEFASTTSVRLTWDKTSYRTATFTFPSVVELVQEGATKAIQVEAHPPTLRYLWDVLVEEIERGSP